MLLDSWRRLHQTNAARLGALTTKVPQVRDIVNVTDSAPLHRNVTEEDDDLESSSTSWENMIHNVQNILGIEVQEPIETKRISFYLSLFLPSRKIDGLSLPADGIVVNAWKEVERPLPKIVSFKNRHL